MNPCSFLCFLSERMKTRVTSWLFYDGIKPKCLSVSSLFIRSEGQSGKRRVMSWIEAWILPEITSSFVLVFLFGQSSKASERFLSELHVQALSVVASGLSSFQSPCSQCFLLCWAPGMKTKDAAGDAGTARREPRVLLHVGDISSVTWMFCPPLDSRWKPVLRGLEMNLVLGGCQMLQYPVRQMCPDVSCTLDAQTSLWSFRGNWLLHDFILDVSDFVDKKNQNIFSVFWYKSRRWSAV